VTAVLLLTLDATRVANGERGAHLRSMAAAADHERFFRLLDAHAMAATWLADEDAEADLIQAIESMRAPQDIVRRPRGAARPFAGPPLATRILDARRIGGHLDTLFAGNAGRRGVTGEWAPRSLQLVGFRSALGRAIRDGSLCHIFFRLAELSRRKQPIRLLEDMLFRVAEERRLRRLRVMTLREVRSAFVEHSLIDAA
jgi:hypothetical protein